MRETSASLKTRDDELSDCKALIRLLSDQLEHAHKRIALLADAPRSIQTIESPSTQSYKESNKKTPILKSPEFVNTPPEGSPRSLVSFESSIRSHTEDKRAETAVRHEPPSEVKESIESITEIQIPLHLEHAPKTIRRRSMRDQASPPVQPKRTPFFNRQSQIPLKGTSKVIARATSRAKADTSKPQLPPTPEDTPLPVKIPAERAQLNLRSRIFRSKSDLRESKLVKAPDPPTKSVVKKNSLIRFWRPKSAKPKEDSNKKQTAKEVFNYPPSPENTPVRETTTNFTATHESDKLSCYPKIRPVSVATTQTTNTGGSTPNPEWRHSIGRQVAEMVQHWEEETCKRSDKIVSCANYVASKRSTSLKDVGASPLAVRAVRDTWTAKSTTSAAVSRASSLRSGAERIDNLRRQREDLVRKMGLSSVSPNALAA